MSTTSRFLLSLLVSVMALGKVYGDTIPAHETRRIDYLIRSVEQLPNASFIRNGAAYDGQAAADHLRLKLREAGARVRTAEDFIRHCGSKSSMSGQPYQIQFADGKVVTSESFLRAKLKELDGRSK